MKIILRKIFSSPKDEVGVILFGSKDTKHSLVDEYDKFEGVAELGPLEIASWELLRKLDKVEPNENSHVDRTSALMVAVSYAEEQIL